MSDDVREYTERLLAETREELARADSKAQLLFAASGVVLGAILASIANGNWGPGDLVPLATIVFAVGAAAYIIAIVALGTAVWPRIHHEEANKPADYYLDIVNYKGAQKRPALREALTRGAANGERATSQLVIISSIVVTKYNAIRTALVFFAVSLLLCGLAVLLG